MLGLRGIPNVMGGVESHCEELLPRVARLAPDTRFVVVGRRAYIGREKTVFRGVEVVPLPSPGVRGLETLVSSVLGVLYARWRGASAVHVHALASGLVVPLARMLGMRAAFTIHGADYRRAKWGAAARTLLRLGERFGVLGADAVICVAPSLAAELRERYPSRARQILHIPNGVPTLGSDRAASEVLEQFGLEPGKFILAVGRIEAGKGFDLLIDAYRSASTTNKLVIVGGAQHEDAYAEALRRSADGCVIFTGVQSRAVLEQLYRSAALFVLPSLHEGLPICALEAGSVGCPTLLSDIPANRDLGLPDTHYFRSGDVRSLADSLEAPADRFAVSPAMFRSFNWDEIAAATLAVYQRLGARAG